MNVPMTIECDFHFQRQEKGGRKEMRAGKEEAPLRGRVPRVARLMALAHRFEKLIRDGAVRDYAELARLGQVTRARVTQIMNLLLLAPDVQEEILFLPAVERGRDPIKLCQLQAVCATANWEKQRLMWQKSGEKTAPN